MFFDPTIGMKKAGFKFGMKILNLNPAFWVAEGGM
jgi:hypothetical protein